MESLTEQIQYYENKAVYFRNLGFEHLAEDFQKMANILINIQKEKGQ